MSAASGDYLKRLVRLLCRWRYGVRAGIKPPLNRNRAFSIRYRICYRIWQVESRVYQWSGLPDDWWEWAITPEPLFSPDLINELNAVAEAIEALPNTKGQP